MARSDSFLGAFYSPETGWGLLLCLSFLSLGVGEERPQSVGDEGGAPLRADRLLAAQLLAILAALLSVWCWQRVGIYCWWPLWSALFAAVLRICLSKFWASRISDDSGPAKQDRVLWRGASFLWRWHRSAATDRSDSDSGSV